MKLAFFTQHKENYGTSENPVIKYKGGACYIVNNVKEADKQRTIDAVFALVHTEWESIETVQILDDDERVDLEEDREFPYYITYDPFGGEWVVTQLRVGDTYDCWYDENKAVALFKMWTYGSDFKLKPGTYHEELWDGETYTAHIWDSKNYATKEEELW